MSGFLLLRLRLCLFPLCSCLSFFRLRSWLGFFRLRSWLGFFRLRSWLGFFRLLFLRVCRSNRSKQQDQNSRANKTQCFHVCCLHHHNFRRLPLVASVAVVVPILSASPG